MILPERVDVLLLRLRDTLDGTVPEYDATELIDAIDAVLLAQGPAEPRPQRRIQLIVELQADTSIDFDPLAGQLGDWLEDLAAENDSHLRVSSDAGSLTLCVHTDPNAASGATYTADLEAWRSRDDADRH